MPDSTLIFQAGFRPCTLLAFLLLFCVFPLSAQEAAPLPGFYPPGEINSPLFSRHLPHAPPRALRPAGGFLELYEVETGLTLRRYRPEHRITTWGAVTGDRWWVALEGGEVVEVDFDAQTTTPAMQFDGDVYWLKVEGHGLTTRVVRAIAEHHIRGVGTVRLLYIKDTETGELQAQVMDDSFNEVHEDAFGRAWLLPPLAEPMTQLRYISVATGELSTITVPRKNGRTKRCFGGMLTLPDGSTFVWGNDERDRWPLISWAAELGPPFFDDGVWDEVDTFAKTGLPTEFSGLGTPLQRLRSGGVRLSYDPFLEMFILQNGVRDGWASRRGMDFWVREQDRIGLYLGDPASLDMQTQDGDPQFQPAPVLEEDWANVYLHRLLQEPVRRVAHIDPQTRTDPLLAAMLRDIDRLGHGVFNEEVHVSAGCDDAWIVGLDTGMIVQMDPETGRFKYMAEVSGFPTAIEFREHLGETKLFVDYWPRLEDEPRSAVLVAQRAGRWVIDTDEAIEDKRPYIWTDRRTAELRTLRGGASWVVWRDLASGHRIRSIDPDDRLFLVGLLDLPDGRVIGYGTDRQVDSDAPVLVNVARGREGIVWHRDIGHLCEQSPLPETGFTHAAYIPEARRVLLVADGKVWSCDRWLGDWRQELPALPEGWGEEDAAEDE